MLHMTMPPHCLFDFPCSDSGEHRLLAFGAPREVLRAEHPGEVRDVLQIADERARAGAWVGGYVAYDAAPAFDTALHIPGRDTALPLAWFAVFDAPLNGIHLPEPTSPTQNHGPDKPWQASITRQHFNNDIARLRQHIHDGDAYQINHTLRLAASIRDNPGAALTWFAALRAAQPDGYCAYLDPGDGTHILSASPELFFRRSGDTLTTRPMKGTVQRGRWAAEDRELASWLHASEKNRAENLMIVDLLRNDLSRIARPNSVKVTDLFAVERHPTLWQMTSTVQATARPGTRLPEIFAALFPCGSVTGAPKAKAMELIARLETEPRGIYCGAIGLIQPGGDATFNVAIRTVTLKNGHATCGVGSGITWDSEASEEYAEALLKARFLEAGNVAASFGLFETLRLENGQYWLPERHLKRLNDSAEYFGFPCDLTACRDQLAKAAREHPAGSWRVRLDLTNDGRITGMTAPLPDTPPRPTFLLMPQTLPRNAAPLHHKTTQRQHLDLALAEAKKKQPDIFEVLLHNEAGELTEFTRGNLVLEIDGQRYTPPPGCGLLDGVWRRELLETRSITERPLTLADLKRARRILFINSLRGEFEVFLADISPSPEPVP